MRQDYKWTDRKRCMSESLAVQKTKKCAERGIAHNNTQSLNREQNFAGEDK